jgi:hypothetical protein
LQPGPDLQPLTPTNPHCSVVGYGPFSLWVIHKEGLCPSSGDINRLMMMMMIMMMISITEFTYKQHNITPKSLFNSQSMTGWVLPIK